MHSYTYIDIDTCIHIYIYIYTYVYYIYIYIHMSYRGPNDGMHPVCVLRFSYFRTQPMENIAPLPMKKRVSGQPNHWRKSWYVKSCTGCRTPPTPTPKHLGTWCS